MSFPSVTPAERTNACRLTASSSEKAHLEKCTSFCQRRVRSFAKLPPEARRLQGAPSQAAAFSAKPELGTAGRSTHQRSLFLRTADFLLRTSPLGMAAAVALAFIIGAAGSVAFNSTLGHASRLQRQIQSLKVISGVEKAVSMDFAAVQPNIARLQASLDLRYVQSMKVTCDGGETWREIHETPSPEDGLLAPAGEVSYDITLPRPTGTREVSVLARAAFRPEVLMAFPECSSPDHTDIKGLFLQTPTGITRLIRGDSDGVPSPEISVSLIPLAAAGWELDGDGGEATADLAESGGVLVNTFALNDIGQYVLMRHSIPGATFADPSVSLKKVTAVGLEILWNADFPVTIEPRLCDSQKRIVGVTRLIEPSAQWQTLRIPVSAMSGYFGSAQFDIEHVERIDLAVARKASYECSAGSLRIRRVELWGTTELAPCPLPERMVTITALSLDPQTWAMANSDGAGIKISDLDGSLACELTLPHQKARLAPWASIETKLEERDFRSGMVRGR
jgi:hypothetical protein